MRFIVLTILFAGAILVWAVPTPRGFSVSFLDVGQGDAVFIEAPGGAQMLVDGGADGSVLRELSHMMPLWDRHIDAVVATHPDKDHIGGLVEVLERYDVGAVIEPGIENNTPVTEAFQETLREKNISPILARRGMRIDLGNGAYADVLFPDRALPNIETNTGSIIMRVTYGATSFMLTGDAPASVEKYLVSLDKTALDSDVLKAGHHGSKTSSAESFLIAVSPERAVFSRGCDNTYGHPHPEVVERFETLKIPTLDTCGEGTITFYSDGQSVLRKKP